MVLVLDNYDSFTYNLVQYLGELGADGRGRAQRRGDASTQIAASQPDAHRHLAGAGPARGCRHHDGRDPASSGSETPILGVCLGHQAIGAVFGGSVVRAPVPMHGKTSTIEHDGRGVFSGLDRAVSCLALSLAGRRRRGAAGRARGHGADARKTAPSWACATARWPVHGVQFHPESILTGEGRRILRNFLERTAGLTMFPRADRQADAARGPHERGGRRGDGRGHGGPRAPTRRSPAC